MLVSADVLHDDVGYVVFFDRRRHIDVDLDLVLHILLFDRVQERAEPLSRAKVADNPSEVHLDGFRSEIDVKQGSPPWKDASAWSY